MNHTSSVTKTLLIVDDSRVSRMMIKGRVLAACPLWTIQEAANATEALECVKAQAPDYISMDMNMPGLSGFDAIEQIRATGCVAKIAMLTANIQQSSRNRAAEIDVYFVQKPATEAAVHTMLAYFNGAA